MFFFAFISQQTSGHIDKELKNLVTDEGRKVMQQLHDHSDSTINWQMIRYLSATLKNRYTGSAQQVEDNNRSLMNNTLCFVLMFATGLLMVVLYLAYKRFNLRLRFILLENILIFTLVGMIEIYFFQEIASKYVPILPDAAAQAVLDRIKDRLQQN